MCTVKHYNEIIVDKLSIPIIQSQIAFIVLTSGASTHCADTTHTDAVCGGTHL